MESPFGIDAVLAFAKNMCEKIEIIMSFGLKDIKTRLTYENFNI